MIDEYFLEHPQAKLAVLALAAVYIWFMILVPLFMLFKKGTSDKDPPKGITFFRLVIGAIPLGVVAWYYWQAIHQPPPEPPKPEFDWEGFSNKLTSEVDRVEKLLGNPRVYYVAAPQPTQQK